MRLIAYTSVSHFGFIVLGIFAMTSVGQNGSTLYMVNHGFSTAALFLIAAMLVKRRGSRRIADFGGWQRVTPVLAGTFLVAGLSRPGAAGAVELRQRVPRAGRHVPALQGGGGRRDDRHRAGRALHPADVQADDDRAEARGRVRRAPTPGHAAAARRWRRRAADRRRSSCSASSPSRVLDVINPAVDRTLQHVGVTDPSPTNAVPAAEGTQQVSRRPTVRLPHACHAALPAPTSTTRSPPMLIVFGAALVGVLVEAFAPRRARHAAQVASRHRRPARPPSSPCVPGRATAPTAATLGGSVVIDGPALFLQGTILSLLAVLGVLTMAERFAAARRRRVHPAGCVDPGLAAGGRRRCAPAACTTEVFPLTLFAVGGMMLFPAAGDLLTMFVALEVLSLPLYILCGLARRRRLLSQEASLKYFLLGAFSLGVLPLRHRPALRLRRLALPRRHRHGDRRRARRSRQGLLLPGVVLVLVGLLFKVGAVPFHSWTPDVYQGAPTPVTGFMAACTKVAAFGAILRVVYVGVGADRWDWQPVRLRRRGPDHGRRLGPVGHPDRRQAAARLLLDRARRLHPRRRARASTRPASSGVMFYLVAYGFTTIAAFAVVPLVRTAAAEATHLSQWAGLGKQPPGRRRRLRLPPAGLRRHPADVGLHREVRRRSRRPSRTGARRGWLVVGVVLAARSRRSSTSASSC